MHECASVHAAMCEHTRHHTTNKHVECGKSRQTRDFNDEIAQLQYNPFDCQDPRFRWIVTGVEAADSDGINCNVTEKAGI